LQLVDEQHQCGIPVTGCHTGSLQEVLQVEFQITVVGQSRLGFQVDPHLDVLELDPERLCESRQGTQRAFRQCFRLGVAGQAQQRTAQFGGQNRRQRSALGSFDAQGLDAGGLGILAHAVQQHGLADAAQPRHDDIGGMEAAKHPVHGDFGGFDQLLAAGKLGGAHTGAGAEGIAAGIHRLSGLSWFTNQG